MPPEHPRRPDARIGRWTLQGALLVAAYVATARLGAIVDGASGIATLVWPPSGIAVGALVLGGIRLWPAVFAGALLADLGAGVPAVGIAAGQALEAVLAFWLLVRTGFEPSLSRPRDVMALVLAALVAPVAGAGIGAVSACLGGLVDASALGATVSSWWLGDALGVLIVTPVLVVFARAPDPPVSLAEAGALFASVAIVTLLIFWHLAPSDPLGLVDEPYLVFPLLIWAALRFRQHGVSGAVLLLSSGAMAGTLLGRGPFAQEEVTAGMLHLHGFLGFVAVAALTGGAAVAERDRALRVAEKARREAESAVVARDEFLSIAAHELKTPLTTLKLQVQRVLREHEPVPGADRIVRQVDRLTRQIDALLDVSRAMSGRLELQPEETDLRGVVEDVIRRNQEQLTAAACPVSVQGPLACTGTWDRAKLEQIVLNLITNAVKYGAGAPVEVTLRCDAGSAGLSVRDHGIGIRPEDRARIFQRFSRAVTPGAFGGLGLGLWIVAQIVEAMRGRIEVASEPGQGATFTVILPRSA